MGWPRDIYDEPTVPDALECPICNAIIPPHSSKCQVCGGDFIWGQARQIFWSYPLTEYDFVAHLVQLLNINEGFRNVQQDHRDIGEGFITDIFAEEKINGEWEKLYIECKVTSSFTESRLQGLIDQLSRFRAHQFADPEGIRFVFTFPGELDLNSKRRISQLDIEIWDLPYLSERFKEEIPKIFHPILQPLLTKKPSIISPDLQLIRDLKDCNPGKAEWPKYQKLVGKILERLFCPPLAIPISELFDYTKTNRRDFVIPNYAENGFWAFVRSQYSGDFIVVDAKNLKGKISKSHVLQISNYLKKHKTGLFGIIVCRDGGNRSCVQTIREAWAFDQKLIITCTDSDVEKMLLEKANGREPEIILRQKIEDFRITL